MILKSHNILIQKVIQTLLNKYKFNTSIFSFVIYIHQYQINISCRWIYRQVRGYKTRNLKPDGLMDQIESSQPMNFADRKRQELKVEWAAWVWRKIGLFWHKLLKYQTKKNIWWYWWKICQPRSPVLRMDSIESNTSPLNSTQNYLIF